MKLFLLNLCFLALAFGRIVEERPKSSIKGNGRNVLYKEKDGHRVAEVIYAKNAYGNLEMRDCFLAGEKNIADLLVAEFPADLTETLSSAAMTSLVEKCSKFLLTAMKSGVYHQYTRQTTQRRAFLESLAIYPGTKWCGAGHVADHFEDLGSAREADMCCRSHDHCKDNIPALGEKYGLKNKAIFTKSHCDCDREFNTCLRKVDDGTSNTVGRLYWNLLQVQCFEQNHPIKSCLRYNGWLPLIYWSCQEYELDTSAQHVWQFFDAKYFE